MQRTRTHSVRPITLSSGYVIADGGYLHWSVIIDGFDPSPIMTKYKFTEWIGSVRKDVEYFFAILKKRFRFLIGTTMTTGSLLQNNQ